MHYDLLMQSMTVGVAYDPAPAEAAFDAKGAVLLPDGTRRFRLNGGDVSVQRLVEGGAVVATEVRVPISDKADLVRETLIEVVGIAQGLGLKVVDPQLTRSVLLNDEAAVADRFLQNADFAGRYSGVSAAVPANFGDQDPALKPGTRMFLVIGAVAFVLWMIVSSI
jgi:hypothetical protein